MNVPIFKSISDVEAFAKETGKVLMVKDGAVLDVTTFAKHHPGGEGLVLNYKNTDISELFNGHYELSYKVADSMAIGSFTSEISKIVDFKEPLMPQVWKMSQEEYLQLVKSPHWMFTPTPRLFKTDFLEEMSRNPWYHIVIFHVFVYTWLVTTLNYENLHFWTAIPAFVLGMLFHTYVQYALHRWVFHAEAHIPDNRVLRYIHFLLHGVHHMIPMDPNRLVLPPSVAVLFMIFGYFTIYQVVYPSDYELRIIFFTGQGACYLMYDLVHFCLHHLRFKSGYLRSLQKYHNQHHYSHEEAGYGVSSKLWDIVFRTELKKQNQRA